MGLTVRTDDVRARLHVPLVEDDDLPPADGADEDVVGATFFLEYESASGELSEREILVIRCVWEGKGLCIYAHCLLRDRMRAFRADRIITLISARTGEVIAEPAEFFAKIAPPRRAAIDEPPPERAPRGRPAAPKPRKPAKLGREDRDRLRDAVRPCAIPLMYVARADHDISGEEVAVVADLIRDVREHLALPVTAADEHLLQEMTSLLPTGNLLYRALKAYRFGDQFPPDLPQRLTRMVRADGRFAPEEEVAFREVVATLRRVSE